MAKVFMVRQLIINVATKLWSRHQIQFTTEPD